MYKKPETERARTVRMSSQGVLVIRITAFWQSSAGECEAALQVSVLTVHVKASVLAHRQDHHPSAS